jgi:hypothetical protein
MLAVFVNNKLISCDTIMPLVMEVAERCGGNAPIRLLTLDPDTYDAIQSNIVLRDAIAKVGTLELIGRRSRGSLLDYLIHRVRSAKLLGGLVISALSGRAVFIHFRQLLDPPLQFLSRINRAGTYFCESDSWGENDLMVAISEISGPRVRREQGPSSGALVGFQPTWAWLSHPSTASLPRYVFGPTRNRKLWLDYIRGRADADFAKAFREANIAESQSIISIMLGYFGPMSFLRNGDSVLVRLRETLDILEEVAADVPVFLKPHVITDMNILREELGRRPNLRAIVTNLHPCMLATRSRAFIANYYSTTLADAFSLGVPTIEFSDYSARALEITNGRSMRPEYVSHFAQDMGAAREAIRKVMSAPKPPLPTGTVTDPSGLLEAISDRLMGRRQPSALVLAAGETSSRRT